MLYPKTIIELDDYFTKEKMERFIKMMNEHFDISENEIEIFDAKKYVNESEFSGEIYNQVFKDLATEYGTKKAFKDEELFGKITELTYPAVGEFLNKYVAGETPIPYEQFFAKMGVTEASIEIAGNPFLKDQTQPYITVDPNTKEIMILPEIELNAFFTTLGIKNNDKIIAINDTAYNLDNIYDMIMTSMNWKDGEAITVKIKRDGKEQTLKGKIVMPKEKQDGYQATDNTKKAVREAWLRG